MILRRVDLLGTFHPASGPTSISPEGKLILSPAQVGDGFKTPFPGFYLWGRKQQVRVVVKSSSW